MSGIVIHFKVEETEDHPNGANDLSEVIRSVAANLDWL
jgi:hypothetical protein